MTCPDNHDDVIFSDEIIPRANADRPTETDKTEKPIDVTNIDFLEKIFRQAQTSVYLVGLAPRTLAKLRCVGGGPSFRRFGRRIVYERGELARWARSRLSPSFTSTSTVA